MSLFIYLALKLTGIFFSILKFDIRLLIMWIKDSLFQIDDYGESHGFGNLYYFKSQEAPHVFAFFLHNLKKDYCLFCICM